MTSVPKMALGAVYAVTFATMGMSLAAVGLLATGIMWSLLAAYRSPSATAASSARAGTPVAPDSIARDRFDRTRRVGAAAARLTLLPFEPM